MPPLILWGAPLTLLPGRLMVVERGEGEMIERKGEKQKKNKICTTRRKYNKRETPSSPGTDGGRKGEMIERKGEKQKQE